MKSKVCVILGIVLSFILLVTALPACRPVLAAESYMAIIPRVLHSGNTEELSVALLNGERLAYGEVEVVLAKGNQEILKVRQTIAGKDVVQLKLPQLETGDYEIRVNGPNFKDKTSVRVETSFLIFLETDKPIYKPGQTIHISAISLNAELRPVSQPATVEVLDAKGIKVFRSEITTDEYGMASLDLPLSEEPNLGVWKLTAGNEGSQTQLDVRVEKYVLPKYEVKVELPKEWFLASERISGRVDATYSFGKPVSGELEIRALRYVGTWQEYARLTKAIEDGQVEFDLPAVGYAAGVPGAAGMGNVNLEFIVREKATGYEEKTTRLLTVAQSPLNLQIIPESAVFKPGLPFNFLLLSENPGRQPVPAKVDISITYLNADYKEEGKETRTIDTVKGKALVEITPPEKSVALIIYASTGDAETSQTLLASYSPSGNFIHLEQTGEALAAVGQTAKFHVYSTKEAANFYYEVVALGKVVFSDFTRSHDIAFKVTPQMAPSSRLLVYQILPNSEVAADYLPFEVQAQYPQDVKAEFSTDEAKPGDSVNLNIDTQGQAKVRIAAVDKSVFILAENRLNLEQVFAELERLYMQPQAKIHDISIHPSITTKGASDIFKDAGVVVLSNNQIPSGKEYKSPQRGGFWDGLFNGGFDVKEAGMQPPIPAPLVTLSPGTTSQSDLAEVQKIRQFFPETWLWQEVTTDANGKAALKLTVPDTITTWMLRAVALSKEHGLGIAQDELRAFQPFFIKLDLPYSAIRGEEFPVKVAVYNYLDQAQSVVVELEKAGWFELLDNAQQTVQIAAGEVGSASFKIKAKGLGINQLKVSARSPKAADAVIQPLIIQPEGVPREFVENLVLAEGAAKTIDTTIPSLAIADSGRVYLALTSSYLTQTIDGLEGLIQMPFGCGEQNMILFAPDVFITKYLRESGQLKPEVMAKAEKLMITGYQRELTYRRSDGSFSAFGNSDQSGSLWLTAFVLKSFAQAKGLIYIDDSVLADAQVWIIQHQNADGSFDVVGFVHHQEMLGGLKGKDALTAYTAIALMEAGEKTASAKAVAYLESKLSEISDPYTLAIASLALEMAGSPRKDAAYNALMALAKEDENGLHWGNDGIQPLPAQGKQLAMPRPYDNPSADIETTAYATLALTRHGDNFNASRAAKWLVSRRNASGGFGSTQDTVMALQALTEYATGTRADVDLTISIKAQGLNKEIRITQANFDVLQIVELPINATVEVSARGKGEAVAQVVRRFNIPQPDEPEPVLKVDVDYDATEVAVNDLVNVNVSLSFNPPEPMEAGMIVLDVAVPTGFTPMPDSIEALVKSQPKIKRYDVAGRKVIFYIENMKPGERLSFSFKVKAMYPVKAKGVASQAYSYYQPEFKGESLSQDITVK